MNEHMNEAVQLADTVCSLLARGREAIWCGVGSATCAATP